MRKHSTGLRRRGQAPGEGHARRTCGPAHPAPVSASRRLGLQNAVSSAVGAPCAWGSARSPASHREHSPRVPFARPYGCLAQRRDPPPPRIRRCTSARARGMAGDPHMSMCCERRVRGSGLELLVGPDPGHNERTGWVQPWVVHCHRSLVTHPVATGGGRALARGRRARWCARRSGGACALAARERGRAPWAARSRVCARAAPARRQP